MKNHEKKSEILEYLKSINEWTTINQISEVVGLHFYKAELLLNELYFEAKVQKDEKPNQIFWKIKNEEEIQDNLSSSK